MFGGPLLVFSTCHWHALLGGGYPPSLPLVSCMHYMRMTVGGSPSLVPGLANALCRERVLLVVVPFLHFSIIPCGLFHCEHMVDLTLWFSHIGWVYFCLVGASKLSSQRASVPCLGLAPSVLSVCLVQYPTLLSYVAVLSLPMNKLLPPM